jgi:hypothetical protein
LNGAQRLNGWNDWNWPRHFICHWNNWNFGTLGTDVSLKLFERRVAIEQLERLEPSKAVKPLELLEPDFSDDGLNGAQRLNVWNGWNWLLFEIDRAICTSFYR